MMGGSAQHPSKLIVQPGNSMHSDMMSMYPPMSTMRKEDAMAATGGKKKKAPIVISKTHQQQMAAAAQQQQIKQQQHLQQQHLQQQHLLLQQQFNPMQQHHLAQQQLAQQQLAQQQLIQQHLAQQQLAQQQYAQQQQQHSLLKQQLHAGNAQSLLQQQLQQQIQAPMPVEPSVVVVDAAQAPQQIPVQAQVQQSADNAVQSMSIEQPQAVKVAHESEPNVSAQTAVAINVAAPLVANKRPPYRMRKPEEYQFLKSIFELVDMQLDNNERVSQYEAAINSADASHTKINWSLAPILNSNDHLSAIEECSVLISDFFDSTFYSKIAHKEKLLIVDQSLQVLVKILTKEMTKPTQKQAHQDDLIWVWGEIKETLIKEKERLEAATKPAVQPVITQQAQPSANSSSKPSLPPKPGKVIKPTNV